ncbi:MAG TPA: hypothetical protein VM582_00720 [Candidatus Thermoplasmatota archaeon]|nr:hypothetical protein [Candidatus Thermoplasmatota archaeon]
MTDPADAAGFHAVNAVVAVAAAPVFLLLVSDARLAPRAPVPPARHPAAPCAAALAGVAGYFAAAGLYLARVEPDGLGAWRAVYGPLARLGDVAALLAFAYSLVAALAAYARAAPGTAARQHARAYATAFGVRDAAYIVTIAWGFVDPSSPVPSRVPPVVSIVFVVLLAVGVLRTQLFDIDLRIKWTIRQGTVAAAFVAVFFVVSESAAAFFEGRAGTYVGIAAAGLLVFALAPLQRAAERFSDRAMPDVRPTSEYVAYKKLEVYRAALEGALADARVAPREREILDRRRAKLGISSEDADAMERELAAAA